MADRRRTRNAIGYLLTGVGMTILVMVAGCAGLNQTRDAQVREQLRTTSPSVSVATDTPGVGSPAPIATQALPGAAQTATAPSRSAQPSALPVTTATVIADTPQPSAAAATSPVVLPEPVETTTGVPASPPALPAAGNSAVPVRLVIDDPAVPGLKVDTAVVPMGWQVVQTGSGPRSEWAIPKDAAGHHINSANLGEQGNIVISGHNNIYGQVFKPISLAWDNDTRVRVDEYTDQSANLTGHIIQLFDKEGRRFDFAIAAFYRLRDTGVSMQQRIANARFMQPTTAAQLTLITCWPPTSNTHRLVVIAYPVP